MANLVSPTFIVYSFTNKVMFRCVQMLFIELEKPIVPFSYLISFDANYSGFDSVFKGC